MAASPEHPIVSASELRSPQARRHILFVDARSGPEGREAFKREHLEGAVRVDLDDDLSASVTDPGQGGRHPLPKPETFTRLLQWLGAGSHVNLVVYDDQGGANAAARFWWMARAAGVERVRVLDGGWAAALAEGIPTETKSGPRPTVRHMEPITRWNAPIAEIDEVVRALSDPSKRVIDVRSAERYAGDRDPFETPGHMPGAVNFPYAENLTAEGRFLPPAELRGRIERILEGRSPADVIVSCGSGVTACHTVLAFAAAGFALPKLYVGSYSEYVRSGHPIAKGSSPR